MSEKQVMEFRIMENFTREMKMRLVSFICSFQRVCREEKQNRMKKKKCRAPLRHIRMLKKQNFSRNARKLHRTSASSGEC